MLCFVFSSHKGKTPTSMWKGCISPIKKQPWAALKHVQYNSVWIPWPCFESSGSSPRPRLPATCFWPSRPLPCSAWTPLLTPSSPDNFSQGYDYVMIVWFLGKTCLSKDHQFFFNFSFLAALGLVAVHRLSLVVRSGGSTLVVVCRLFMAVTSLVAESTGSKAQRFQ